MRRETIAQSIIAVATTPDRAAAVVGDLLEEESSGGRHWFWWTVAGATLAFAWLNIVRFLSGRNSAVSGGDSREEIMDFLRFVWKRKWLVVIPVVLCTTATGLVAYSQPVIYRSESRIMVVPQRVPESFVPSSMSTTLEDRLQGIKQQVLSRTRLERIIAEFNLYAVERKTGIMEDLVQRMRTRDIGIETRPSGHDGDAAVFTVSFQSVDPRTAMRVTEKLSSLFINENLEDRSRMAENTAQFLEGHSEALAKEVDEFAARMERDRIEHRTSPRSQVLEYEELQKTYRALLANRQQARIAASLEARQIGETFKLVDVARIPTRPEGPERLSIGLFGAGAGLGVGLLLMLAASMRKPPPPAPVIPAASPAAE